MNSYIGANIFLLKKTINTLLRIPVSSFVKSLHSIHNHPEFENMKWEVFNKITKAKLNPIVGDKLDNGSIEFELLNALEDMLCIRGGHVSINSQFAYF